MESQHGHEHDRHLRDYEDETVSSSGCCCFQLFSFKLKRTNETEERHLLNGKEEEGYQQQNKEETWVVKSLKKVREVSELLAGPKWKTFIRKLSGHVKNKKNQKNGAVQFQYTPVSYALNFESGAQSEEDEFVRSFSTRFAAPVVNKKPGPGL